MNRLLAVSAALALCACSGSQGSANFRLDPASAHLTAGGAPITFTVVVTAGQAGPVAWNLDGPGRMQIAADAMSAVYTPPDAVGASTTATISAEMGGKELSATITIDPMPALAGKVVGSDGAPIPNAVVIADSGNPTTADASGSFTIAGVKAPYAIAASDPASRSSVVYLGLRRTDPTLVLGIPAGTARSAVVSGVVHGNLGIPSVARVAFDAPGCTAFANATADGRYELGFRWSGAATSVSGALHALEWTTDSGGRPLSYGGAASLAHEASDFDHASGHDLALAAIGTDTLSGATAELLGFHLDAVYANGGRIPLLDPLTWDSPGSQFSYKTPHIDGTLELTGLSQYAGGAERFVHRAGLASNAAGIVLAPAGMPWPIEPGEGAAVTRSTVFRWYAFGTKPVYLIAFRSTLPGGAAVDVITASQQLALDAASPLGLAPPAGTYTWEVKATTAVTSPDEAAGPDGFYAKTNDYQTAHTGPRTLTYAP